MKKWIGSTLVLSGIILAGCLRDEPIAYERVDLNKCDKHVVYFRNCLVARSFNTANIGVFSDDMITFTQEQWKTNIPHQMFNHVLIEAAKRGIKVTKLPSFNCVDCFIENIFYDKDKKEAVISFTINFAGKIKPFYIVQKADGEFEAETLQILFTRLFQTAAEHIADFVVKNIK